MVFGSAPALSPTAKIWPALIDSSRGSDMAEKNKELANPAGK
jgi:hypothetical protein